MIKSPYPLDQTLGLEYYYTDTPGTEGRLRTLPEDFIVEELGEQQFREGKYLICRLTRTNWDQQRAVKEIAKRLAISHQRISFAGTKDKRAKTTQFISIYQGDPDSIRSLHITDMDIEPLGTSDHGLSLGELQGNRFSIRIRETKTNDDNSLENFLPYLSKGVPNYVGYQRFGIKRPITHVVGLSILRGDFQQAVMDMVGTPGEEAESEEREGRLFYAETSDPKESLHHLPVRLSLERSLLHHLTQYPDDFSGAIYSLPRTLRSMFVSAVQSWIFNKSLSLRLSDGRSLHEPEIGDWLIFADGKTDQVTRITHRSAMMQMKRGRCQVALMMPGSDLIPESGPDAENIQNILNEYGITPDMFKEASKFLEMKFAGAYRPVNLSTDISITYTEKDPVFSFDLQPGQYATTILREIMKTDPRQMV